MPDIYTAVCFRFVENFLSYIHVDHTIIQPFVFQYMLEAVVKELIQVLKALLFYRAISATRFIR